MHLQLLRRTSVLADFLNHAKPPEANDATGNLSRAAERYCTVNLEFAGYAVKEFRERRNVGPLPDGRGSDNILLQTRGSTCDTTPVHHHASICGSGTSRLGGMGKR